jgi:hypothetical protein
MSVTPKYLAGRKEGGGQEEEKINHINSFSPPTLTKKLK